MNLYHKKGMNFKFDPTSILGTMAIIAAVLAAVTFASWNDARAEKELREKLAVDKARAELLLAHCLNGGGFSSKLGVILCEKAYGGTGK